ncbi:MAG: transcriptional regulator [Promethearchaeota archaeon]
MERDKENSLRNLIEKSQMINSKAFNLTRCLLLALMSFNRNGIQYRELKTLLNISDGKLKSNIDYLEELEYIKSVQVILDQRKVHIYMITDLGENELKKISDLMMIMKKVWSE